MAQNKMKKPVQTAQPATKPVVTKVSELDSVKSELASQKKMIKTGFVILLCGWLVMLVMIGVVMSDVKSADSLPVNIFQKANEVSDQVVQINTRLTSVEDKLILQDKTFQNIGQWAQQFSNAVVQELMVHRAAIENVTGKPLEMANATVQG